MTLEEALASPTYPPAEASLALLAFLRDELPLGGTAAEARLIRLFPLLVSRIVGGLNAADGHRHEPGGWLGRRERWASAPSYGAGGRGGGPARPGAGAPPRPGASRRDAVFAPYPPGMRSSPAGSIGRRGQGSSLASSSSASSSSSPSLDRDPVVQLLSASPGGRREAEREREGRPGQPTLIDSVSDESVLRPGVRFSFDVRALPPRTQAALVSLLLEGAGAGAGAARQPQAQAQPQPQSMPQGVRPNAARLLRSAMRVPAPEQAELRFALQRQYQLAQQRRQQKQQGSPGPGPSPGGGVWLGAGPGAGSGAVTSAVLPLPSDPGARVAVSLSMLEYYLVHFVRFAAVGQGQPVAATAAAAAPARGMPSTSASAAATAATATPADPGRAPNAQSSSSSYGSGGGAGSGIQRHTYSPPGSYGSGGGSIPYGEQVYMHLLSSYLKRYLSHSDPMEPSGGGSPTSQGLPSSLAPPARSFPSLSREAEFFLRLILELWLDGSNSAGEAAPTTSEALRRLPRVHHRGGGEPMTPSSPLPEMTGPDIGLDRSADLADLGWDARAQYAAPSLLVRRGLRALVKHVVSDPGLGNAVAGGAAYTSQLSRGVAGALKRGKASLRSSPLTGGAAAGSPTESNAAEAVSTDPGGWCLTPAMTAFQAPFYNFVRMNLRHAPVHVPDSAFYSAMLSWLVWLEPWNVSVRKNRAVGNNFSSPTNAKKFLMGTVSSGAAGGRAGRVDSYTSAITSPKASSASKYTKEWEPYIAANLHLYTVPLAIFLRRARELDFSHREFHRSLGHIQKVFRVYTPEVVASIDALLARQSSLVGMAAQHERILGEFCPPRVSEGLSSCYQDMHNLLEEIFLQHRKRVNEEGMFEKFEAMIERLGGVRGDEHALDKVLGHAKNIANLPSDYNVLPGEKKGGRGHGASLIGSNRFDEAKPERVDGGFLTEAGRQQIMMGTRKCSAIDVFPLGDTLYARTKSYELPFLVFWTVQASEWLNKRLGLVPEHIETAVPADISVSAAQMLRLFREGENSRKVIFRFNLRFLADYRNIILILISKMIFNLIV